MMGLSQRFLCGCRFSCLPSHACVPPPQLVWRSRGGVPRLKPATNFQVRMYSILARPKFRVLSFPPLEDTKALVYRHEEVGPSPDGRLILVDGKALVYRAYHRISAKILHGTLNKMSKADSSDNSSWDSIMTTVVSLTEVLNVLELQATHIAVVFDYPGATFRHNMYLDYKSHRLATPDTVQHAVKHTKNALLGMGIKVIEVPGVEADDVIGTLAMKAVEKQMKVRVLSLDRDFFQLLSPQLRILRFRQGGPGFHSFGLEDFKERYSGLEVSQFVDMRALVGDVSDNIPGVTGIGELTALKLILEFGTLENLFEHRSKITQARARTSLLEDKGEAFLSKKLLELKLNIPEFVTRCTLQDLRCKMPEDGGRAFGKLAEAYGAIVGPAMGADLFQRTIGYWNKIH